jgi:hypothetical protein
MISGITGLQKRGIALWLQSRRRTRNPARLVGVPIINNSLGDWNRTVDGWADVIIEFRFDSGNLPLATFEFWSMQDDVGASYALAGVMPSNERTFIQVQATNASVFIWYKLRYRNGSMIGPFSDEFGVDV